MAIGIIITPIIAKSPHAPICLNGQMRWLYAEPTRTKDKGILPCLASDTETGEHNRLATATQNALRMATKADPKTTL